MSNSNFLYPLGDAEPAYYSRRGAFVSGGTISSARDVLLHTNGSWYQYVGSNSLPFTVAAGTVPDSNWKNVGQALLLDQFIANKLGKNTFAAGATLTDVGDFIYDASSKIWYHWAGTFPKSVTAGAIPLNSGGISSNAWIALGDSKPLMAARYGALGNGTSDDTAAFISLEAAFKGVIIDLGGKNHKVTAIPVANKYINGRWVMSKSTTVSTTTGAGTAYAYTIYINSDDGGTSVPISVVERDARVSMAKLAFRPTQTAGLQGMCFDEANSKIYGMYFDTSSGSERTVIARFDMSYNYPALAPQEMTTVASAQVGHQGLSIEYVTNNIPKLWAAVRYDATNFPLGHRQVVRFEVSDGAAPANVEAYTLFGSEFSYTGNSTMVAVSYDQHWVVAVGRKTSRDFWVRVFDRRMLVTGGPGDYSNAWTYEFNVDCDILSDDNGGTYTPFQNVACDGDHIYLVAGNAQQFQKKIHQYTIRGRRVGVNNTISVGLTQAQADGTFYEPEALAFYKPVGATAPVLAMLALTTGKKNYIWELGAGVKSYSGGYTPTLTAVTNVTGVTAYKCNYQRMDDVVTISGRVAIQATAAGAVVARMSLPVPLVSAGSLTQAQGVINDATTQGGRIQLDTTSGLLEIAYTANTTTNTAFSFTATYRLSN